MPPPWGKTKITATLGPASRTPEQIANLLRAGADCLRINFSHGDAESLEPLLLAARKAAQELALPIPLLADVQGPKLRIGVLPEEGVLLREDEPFVITTQKVEGSSRIVSTPHRQLPEVLEPGETIYLSDGTIRLRVEDLSADEVRTRVVTGGRLFSHKGINLPGQTLEFLPTITEKDERDLGAIAASGFDMVAVSFVRRAEDIERARQLLGRKKIPVMAKIERQEAIDNLDTILEASDGIMLARGDLGVELPLERVPILQKEILAKAARAGKWVIVATQMLGSMVVSPRPTRAEASDVAGAIFDGADAIMLSEETATGAHPTEAVATMERIAREVQESAMAGIFRPQTEAAGFAGSAAGAAILAAERLGAKAIVTLAGSGLTALLVSKQRPRLPTLALSANLATLRRLNVLWGVIPVGIPEKASAEDQIRAADRFLLEGGWAKKDDPIVIIAALPLGAGREPNTLRFHHVGREPG